MMLTRRAHWVAPLLAVGLVGIAACDDDDDDLVEPTTGTIEVTVTATGEPADPDGFSLMLDGTEVETIEATGGSATLANLDEGTYSLELGGLAENCTVTEENPRDVTVTAGETTDEAFTVTCAAAQTGSLAITTSITGDNPDPDGYQISINGGAPVAVGVAGTTNIPDLTAGDATWVLTGVQPNCGLAVDNPGTVTITPGATPTALALDVTCALNTGSALVTTATTGANPDADGFTLTVDGGATPITLLSNGQRYVYNLAAGDHTFQVDGLAANCTLTETNPQTVTVTDVQEAAVTVTVTCN